APVGLLCGAFRDKRRWVILAVVSLLAAWGPMLGLGGLLFKIPMLNQFKAHARYGVGFLLMMSLMAGGGLDALWAAALGRRWRPFWIFGAAGGALLALTLAIWMWPGLPARQPSGLIVPLVSGAAAAMAAMALIWLARRPRWFKRGLV